MQHIKDEWLAQGVRSTFSIAPGANIAGKQDTIPCGLGWRFSVERVGPTEHTYLFGHDPYLIHRSDLGNLSVPPDSVSYTNMVAIEQSEVLRELPDWGWRTMGTWTIVDPSKLATISFCVLQLAREFPVPWDISVTENFQIKFPAQPPTPPLVTPPDSLGERALLKHIDGEDDIVQFLLPSRIHGKRVTEVRPVYASRDVLEALRIPIAGAQDSYDVYRTQTPQDEYDYSSDSDIDDEEPDPAQELAGQSTSRNLDDYTVSVGELATSARSDDLESEVFTSVGSMDDDDERISPDGPAIGLEIVVPREPRRGEVVRLTNYAHRTWRAFVFYMYTGKIAFKRLSSTGVLDRGAADPLHCSPKSMYRIAHKAKLDDLRARCMQAILADLTEANVVREAFSKFSSQYRAVRNAQTDFLVKHLQDPACGQEVERVMQDLSNMPHGGAAAAMIWRKVAAIGGR
ncbi:uncharacterized protein SCHCODRAFT_02635411 [Schizophyllum commune H4-8]|uniref:uncharacterized protein n=1 Tax=Schizophyllum commune (strain H4-8 / FGSC 9210) TaxID=578458 RepID=UPI00216089E9|nr:uncharacterized protein SCHCODRAFT_02635411 [Schizophyllum commune H4-8]KAI5889714.1 hypothetical protein SCHCODRAFT_02635411 [Schizophyllum commune H4-8]